MSWNFGRQQHPLVTINKRTRKEMESNERVAELANAYLSLGTKLAETLKEAECYPTRTDGNEVKDATFSVNVKPTTQFDKESQQRVAIFHEDGTPVLSVTISSKTGESGSKNIMLFGRENITNGAELYSGGVSDFANGSKGTFTRLSDVAESNLPDETKQIIAGIMDSGFIHQRTYQSKNIPSMQSVKICIDRIIQQGTPELVPNKDNTKMVENSYVKYNEDYGTTELRNHNNQILISLSVSGEGEQKAVATDFAQRDSSGHPAWMNIAEQADLDELAKLGVPDKILNIVYLWMSGDITVEKAIEANRQAAAERKAQATPSA